METYERKNRIEEALIMRNMKQTRLAEITKISRGTISNWAKNKYQPKQDSIYKLAKALDVSELWLAGYDVAMERPESQVNMDRLAGFVNQIRKDDRLKQLCFNIADLDPNQFSIIETMVRELTRK